MKYLIGLKASWARPAALDNRLHMTCCGSEPEVGHDLLGQQVEGGRALPCRLRRDSGGSRRGDTLYTAFAQHGMILLIVPDPDFFKIPVQYAFKISLIESGCGDYFSYLAVLIAINSGDGYIVA